MEDEIRRESIRRQWQRSRPRTERVPSHVKLLRKFFSAFSATVGSVAPFSRVLACFRLALGMVRSTLAGVFLRLSSTGSTGERVPKGYCKDTERQS